MKKALVLLNKGVLPLFFSLVLSLSFCSFAQDNENNFVVGELNHPRVANFYKPLIQRAYLDIGIDVTFEKVGGERGLRLLNNGMTDADVIRYDVVSQPDNNIAIVPPALSHGASFLLCIRGAQCDKSVIQNPDKAIAVTTRFFFNMHVNPDELNANIFEFDDFNHVISLLLNGRYDYAILPSDYSEKAIFEQAGIKYISLVEHELVHVIHKKHSHLVDRLSSAIAKQLALEKSNNK
ncbi:hypothetical protein D1814_13485 [Alteromonas sp. BL110]|uniref:hypothetical protein n=1 Tax=Alteromonas sp. BL110 TaxID=1714845 RepID=UPI000E48BB01|nr:hypothetical protein [Alteromonas sp. BL110]AXT39620.1 hypothetical protein D1814_13485 [Alteromonas sp. BL110]RKM81893.1 hypothetical protein D7031_06065 [Alteromonas sp. BL110]